MPAPIATHRSSGTDPLRGAVTSARVLATLAVLFTVYFARPVLVPLAAGFLLTVALRPLANRVAGWGVPRILAAFGLLAAAGVVVLGPMIWMLATARRVLDDLPAYADTLRDRLESLRGAAGSVADAADAVRRIGNSAGGAENADSGGPVRVEVASNELLTTVLGQTGSTLFGLILTAVLALFLIADGDRLLERVFAMLPGMDRERARRTLGRIESDVSVYLSLLTGINIVVGLVTWGLLSLLGVPNAGLLGLVGGLMNYVPYFGPFVAAAVIGAVSLIHFDHPTAVLLPVAAFGVVNLVEAYLLGPMIYGDRLRLNPAMLIVVLALMGWAWGVPGAIMAVPLLVVFKAVCIHAWADRPVGRLFAG